MRYDCILLAAGLSSRMGEWKLLLNYNNKTILLNALDNACKYTGNVFISGGFNIEELKKNIPINEQIRIIENPDYEKGMITSIKAALPYIKSDKFFIALSDMPLIPAEIYKKMSMIEFSNALFPVKDGKRGHPVLIDSSLIDLISKIPDSKKMKDFLSTLSVSEIEVQSDDIFFDIDTMSDYRKLLKL
ncbi:MAG: NTP transferase domain-containing protein [Bacteroidales bacterium]|jgi:molybdenum cofactor cytidylyltransferase|nr:NTP transferase domain-containing protein [Bacteroidales bacterium]